MSYIKKRILKGINAIMSDIEATGDASDDNRYQRYEAFRNLRECITRGGRLRATDLELMREALSFIDKKP